MPYRMLILLLIGFLHLPAQPPEQYVFQHLDQSDGLLHNNVKGMRQDARGFIWVRTPNGLQRYDGSRFISYQTILDNPVSGPVDGGDVYFDSASNEIWLEGNGQIQKLSLSNNVFTTFSWQDLQKFGQPVKDPYRSGNGKAWLLTDKELFESPGNTSNYVQVLHASFCKPGESGPSLYDSANQMIWLTGTNGLMIADKKARRIYDVKSDTGHNPLLDQFAAVNEIPRLIMMDQGKHLWISTWGDRFFRFDPAVGKLTSYSLAAIKGRRAGADESTETLLVNAMFEDKSGRIWIATENAGLLKYDPEKNNFETIEVEANSRRPTQFNYKIYCILQDKEDNLWLGTDHGISIFNPSGQFFRSLRHRVNQPSLPKAEITQMHQCRNGDILIGTWGAGFSVYDSLWNFRRNVVPSGLVDLKMIWSFMDRDDGKVWIGCQHGYLHTYDPVTGRLETSLPPQMQKSTIRSIVKDAEGNVWFGLHSGRITEWNKRQKIFYCSADSPATGKRMPPVMNIFIDTGNKFWVATTGGFKQFDPVQRRFIQTWLPDQADPRSISAVSIASVAPLDDSTLLLGTAFGGINYFSKNTATFSHLRMDQDLPASSIYSLRKSKDGWVWFTTDYNLFKFKPGSRDFIRYNFYPGTINSEFFPAGFYPLRDGSWATTTATEMIAFKPGSDSVARKADPVSISGFRIYDSLIFIDSFLYKGIPITLNSRQNFITIQFASLNFSRLHQTTYYYRLSGVNEDWVNAGNRHFASYTNLPPGKYIFSVRAGLHSKPSSYSTLEIIILPAFWQTWWFLLLCLLAGVGVVWLLVRRRVKAIRFEAEMNRQMMESKMVALRAQMNPHFIFNCLNSIDNLIQLDEKEKATLYLSKFARLIRATLEHSGQPAVPCWKDMETLKLYLELESLRFDNKFSWRLNIAREIMQGDYKVPPLIIQPFVENAIHHGLLNKVDENKQLIVDVTVTGSHIHFVIEDNGVGRAKAGKFREMNASAHQSMGMQITKDRINLFNRGDGDSVVITDLLNDHLEPVGTKVNIQLLNLS